MKPTTTEIAAFAMGFCAGALVIITLFMTVIL
jgi:hypothetical protein